MDSQNADEQPDSKRWEKTWQKIRSAAPATSVVLQLVLAVFMAYYAQQASELQDELVNIERDSHRANVWPVGLDLCRSASIPGSPLLAKITVINQGLQSSGLVGLEATGLDGSGKQHPLLSFSVHEFPEGEDVDDVALALGDYPGALPNFDTIIQPGDRHQILVWFEGNAEETLAYVAIHFEIVPVLGERSAIGMGTTDTPLANLRLPGNFPDGGACFGTKPIIHHNT